MNDRGEIPPEFDHAFHLSRLILPDIEATIVKSGKFKPPLAWRFRAKLPESIRDKIDRKRRANPDYGLRNVQDLIGGRFITLYQSDISQVVSDILSLTHPNPHEEDGRHNQFKGAEILGLTQHIATVGNRAPTEKPPPDSLTDALVYVLEQHGMSSDMLDRQGRPNYSSVHIVLQMKHGDAPGGTLPVEIQVRTIFEDAWGEVDHQLLYEVIRNQNAERTKDDERQRMAQDLGILKRMLDLAGQFAETIKTRGLREGDVSDPRFATIGNPQYVKAVCEATGFPEEFSLRLVELVKKNEALETDKGARKEDYVEQAWEVRAFIEAITLSCSPAQYGKVFYLARMEEPIARLRSEDDKQIERAYRLYEDITKAFPDHPTGWFRRGQAAMKYATLCDNPTRAELANEAAAHYQEAVNQLEKVEKLPKSERFLLISEDQIKKLWQQLPRLHGYALWTVSDLRRVERQKPTTEDYKAVAYAFRMAKDGLPKAAPAGMAGLRQNMLYYAIEARELAATLDIHADDLPTRSWIESLTVQVEEDEKKREMERDIAKWRVLHTLLKAFQFLEWPAREIDQAQALLKVLELEDWTSASKAELYLMKNAREHAQEALYNRARENLGK